MCIYELEKDRSTRERYGGGEQAKDLRLLDQGKQVLFNKSTTTTTTKNLYTFSFFEFNWVRHRYTTHTYCDSGFA